MEILMDLNSLKDKKQRLLHQQYIAGVQLLVKETDEYRWFEYGGSVTQSVMNKKNSEQIASPVSQALLLFLLFRVEPLTLLILGSGGGAIERALVNKQDVNLTSVELSQEIIDISKSYFKFPKEVALLCDDGNDFIYKTKIAFDIICCDLFIDRDNPDFLSTENFYKQLCKITTDNSIVMLNIQAEDEALLYEWLLKIRKYFPSVSLVELSNYENIIVMCSKKELPKEDSLLKRLSESSDVIFKGLDKEIKNLYYIPHH